MIVHKFYFIKKADVTYPSASREEWMQFSKPSMLRNHMMNMTTRNRSPWRSVAPKHSSRLLGIYLICTYPQTQVGLTLYMALSIMFLSTRRHGSYWLE